jgi:hypothetical protein
LKYYIYNDEEDYEEFISLECVAKKFVEEELKTECSKLGIREGSSTVDIIYKKKSNEEVIFSGSAEFLTSEMFETKSDEIINTVLHVHKVINKMRD